MAKSSTPLHQLIPQRIRKALLRLEPLCWEKQSSVNVKAGPVLQDFVDVKKARSIKFRELKNGEYFAPQGWTQTWFKIEIPQAASNERGRRHLVWNAQGETTVYLDNKPWAGLDTCHLSCPLPDKACTLFLDCGNYQTGIWEGFIPNPSAHGLQFNHAKLSIRNEQIFEIYWDLEVLQELVEFMRAGMNHTSPKGGFGYIRPFEKTPPLLRQLLKRLDDAIDLFDAGETKDFVRALKQIYADYPAESWGMKASYVGHAHIDLVWLWPENVTWRKGIHTYSTVMRLMERYPEMTFSMSQPALINKIKKMEPSLFSEVHSKIKKGGFEATGGFEVESDNTIPCGESLIRSLILGQEKFKEINGRYSNTVWLPDVFGYSQCLPQIMAAGGIEHFYTTKMLWSSVTKFPHNSFVWQGADGSEVLAHLATTGYNSLINVSEASDCAAEYRQSDVSDEFLAAAGYGDGGGGPTEAHCERARRLSSLASVPKVAWTKAEDFFRRLSRVREDLPIYRGELYLEYHRGTYTTQGRFKRAFRSLEKALKAHEAVRVVCNLEPLGKETWERSVFAQFHDAIPGSSIGKVYAELGTELEVLGEKETAQTALELKEKVSGTGRNSFTVFNPNLAYKEAVTAIPVPASGDYRVVTESGLELPSQESGSGKERKLLVSLGIHGLEGRVVTLEKKKPSSPANKLALGSSRLSNDNVEAEFNGAGELTALSIDGEEIKIAAPAGLVLCQDNPAEFDAWDIDQSATWLKAPVCRDLKLKVMENGPVRAVLSGSSNIGEKSKATVQYILEEGASELKVRLQIDWKEEHRLLRYEIPTAITNRMARYGCPFGSIERPQLPGTQADEAKWEVPGSRWMALADGSGCGISLITNSKYGFSAKNGLIGLSLLRSPRDPDTTADIGIHEIEFAIGAYSAISDEDSLSTALSADVLYQDFITVPGSKAITTPVTFENLSGVVPSWIMPGEKKGSFTIRLHDTAGQEAGIKLLFAKPPKKVQMVDLFGRPVRAPVPVKGNSCEIKVRAFEVISLQVA